LAFESLPGVKIKDPEAKRTYIIADFFSVYAGYNHTDGEDHSLPDIYNWSDFCSIAETRSSFVFKTAKKDTHPGHEFVIPAKLVPDPAVWLRLRAIIEGAIAANSDVEYSYGRRILPPKTLCTGCDVSREAYIATGIYEEAEINNSNVVFLNPYLDKLIWLFGPLAMIGAFVFQMFYFGDIWSTVNLLTYAVIALLFGGVAGITAYLLSAYAAKTLYRRLVKEDPALMEEITFVVCEEGFIATESRLYNFSDIVHWHKATYFMETNHMYIIFSDTKAVFWMPKRLFPKDVHGELGDFIADRLLQKPVTLKKKGEPAETVPETADTNKSGRSPKNPKGAA
jgi:hypothetical protein